MFEFLAEDLEEGDEFTIDDGETWLRVEAIHRGVWEISVYTADDVVVLDRKQPVVVR